MAWVSVLCPSQRYSVVSGRYPILLDEPVLSTESKGKSVLLKDTAQYVW